MIKEIPSDHDFISTGLSLLCHSWGTVLDLLKELEFAEDWNGIDIPEISDSYWEAAKQILMTALSIAQQGSEFIIKGKIAEISPFLLIASKPNEWPKISKSCPDVYFSDFKTLDSQDLIKVHNMVCSKILPDKFVTKFNELRRMRNAIIHTVDTRINIHVRDVIESILFTFKHLFPNEDWVETRRDFFFNSPNAEIYSTDGYEGVIVREFKIIIDLLPPKSLKEYFGFNKKAKRYICPNCLSSSEDEQIESKTVVLKPDSPKPQKYYCFVCQESFSEDDLGLK